MNIVITGAGKGIGYSLVKRFILSSKEDSYIFAISRNIEQLQSLKIDTGNLIPIQCDITDPSQFANAIKIINDNCTRIDILINNAALLLNKPFNLIEGNEIDQVLNTNFKAPFLLIKELYPLLEKSQMCHIVNISSMGGFQGSSKFAGLSVYSASKAALACLTECLAEEFKSTTIKINALCIGAVETEMLAKAFPNYKAPITSDEMASFIYHFACNNGRFMHGKVIPVALSTP